MVAQLAKANSLVTVCDPFLPNSCPGSLVCEASNSGVQLTCVSSRITSVLVGGVCSPAVRQVVSARFGSSGSTVAVTLNAAAKDAAISCSSVFDAASSALLGAQAWCTVSDRTVTIKLDTSSTMVPGQNLAILANQTVLVDKLQSSVAFSGTVTVDTCLECAPPKAVITGPQVSRASQHDTVMGLEQSPATPVSHHCVSH